MSLIEIVVEGNLASLTEALKGGADVNEADATGATALHKAASSGEASIVKALIEAGATVNVLDQAQQSALDWAVFDGHLEVASLLIDAGANGELSRPDRS